MLLINNAEQKLTVESFVAAALPSTGNIKNVQTHTKISEFLVINTNTHNVDFDIF